jgi:hypothetical protein
MKTSSDPQDTRSKYWAGCSVRCHQRSGESCAARRSPLTTADATTRDLADTRSRYSGRCSVRCHQRSRESCAAQRNPLTTADATTRDVADTRSKYWAGCSVRCHQRSESFGARRSPLTTADATTRDLGDTRSSYWPGCSVRCHQRSGESFAARHSPLRTADAATLDAINSHDLSGVRPLVCIHDQARANRILPDVIPFFAVRFITPQDVIVKARLPERPQSIATSSRWLKSLPPQGCAQTAFQSFDPFPQRQFSADAETNKQMQMVGHYHVTADADVVPNRGLAIGQKRAVHHWTVEKGPTEVRIERHEEERRIVFLKNAFEPRRFPLALGEHATRCSARCRPGARRIARKKKSPLATADATTRDLVDTRSKYWAACSVRCHQRSESFAATRSPLRTADGTTRDLGDTASNYSARRRLRCHRRTFSEGWR